MASNTFGGTVKLDGESEYRKALSTITAQMKVMSSEMMKVTAEFGKNDTSIEGLTSRNKVLNDQIDKQKEKIATLRGALEQSQQQYGENDKKTLSWQNQLNRAEAQLINMDKELKDNENKMKESADATNDNSNKIKEFGKNADDASKKALSLGDIIKANLITDVIKSGLSSLANGVKSIASSMGNAISSGASYADNILTLSAQTGIATEELQAYNAVAELTDVPLETITKSMAKMTKSLESNEDKYNSLGVSIRNADGSLRDNQDIFNETIGKLGEMSNETERDALSMQLFGKSAQDLNPLIKLGADGLSELTTQAREMGAVLSDDGLKALGELDDQFQFFKTNVSATGNILASAFAPAITDVMNGVNGLAQDFNSLIASVISGNDEGVTGAMNSISVSLGNIVNSIAQQAPKLVEMAGTLINTIITAISNNAPMLVNAIVQLVSSISTIIIDNLPTLLDAGIKILLALVQGISQNLPTIIPQLVESLIFMVEVLLDNIDLIIDAGIQLLTGLADGLIEALPILIDKLPEIIDKLVIAITDNLPKLIEVGITLIVKLSEGLIKAIPQLISKIPQIIGSIINGFVNYYSRMGEIGKNLVSGIWNGISNSFTWIKNKLKEWIGNVTSFIKKMFGIHSPSTVFRDEIGTNLALGIGEGFTNQMDSVKNDMAKALPTNFDVTTNSNFKSPILKQNSAFDSDDEIESSNFNPTININSYSKYLSPAEAARESRHEMQKMILKWKKAGVV